MVMEGFKGRLRADGNRAGRVNAQAGLTARLTSHADAKAEISDPITTFKLCLHSLNSL